ncbi:type I-B CRISPR-associated protein Cas8b1/Cst1 [Palaeococcus pacificus]|uniref:type I-B CRISPR-associated protein Cas8b1/Cst1 n=1 Tax=Palaeococcus pacificus TaxID=971279 RepID=UPI001F0064AD|nr:type I-B CRISPR-associated protein Cas8b1/Cst1 [Palaeococcus pacificus]
MERIPKEKTLEKFLMNTHVKISQKQSTSSGDIKAEPETHEPLLNWTGHPFVDAGLVAILLLSGKEKPEGLTKEDIERAIEFVAELYATKEWSSSYLHAMVMPNNGIILANPGTTGPISTAVKNAIKQENGLELSEDAKKELTKRIAKNFDDLLANEVVMFLESISQKYSNQDIKDIEKFAKEIAKLVVSQPFVIQALKRRIKSNLSELFNDIVQASIGDSICILCGKRQTYHKKGIYRAVFPLLGTGDVPNYFHSANIHGADVCAHCLFLTQFMPLAAYRLSRVLVIHAYPYDLMLTLSKEALEDIKKTKLASNARGFKRPENFLFHIIGEITRRIERDDYWENGSVTLYYFACNNQSQELDVIPIPNSALRFVTYASLVDYTGWKHIVAMGWRKRPKEEQFEEFERKYPNEVYAKLLNNESILGYFYDTQKRKANTNWRLLAFYCKEVLGLDKDALEFIKGVGDRIVETIEKLPDNQLKRRVRELENVNRLYQFEAFFIGLEKLRQEKSIEKPLMTFDEFARILTSYGEDINVSWKTVRNLLLFRIYEKLHNRLMKASEEPEGSEEEEYSVYGVGGDEE